MQTSNNITSYINSNTLCNTLLTDVLIIWVNRWQLLKQKRAATLCCISTCVYNAHISKTFHLLPTFFTIFLMANSLPLSWPTNRSSCSTVSVAEFLTHNIILHPHVVVSTNTRTDKNIRHIWRAKFSISFSQTKFSPITMVYQVTFKFHLKFNHLVLSYLQRSLMFHWLNVWTTLTSTH